MAKQIETLKAETPLVEKLPTEFFTSIQTFAEITPEKGNKKELHILSPFVEISHTISGKNEAIKILFEYPDSEKYAVSILRLFEEVEKAREALSAKQRVVEADSAKNKPRAARKTKAKKTQKRKTIRF